MSDNGNSYYRRFISYKAGSDAGDAELQRIMLSFRPLVDEGTAALEAGDHARFRSLMRRNFDSSFGWIRLGLSA